MKTPEAVTLPLVIEQECTNALDIYDACGISVFQIVQEDENDLTAIDWEIAQWIVTTLNDTIDDS